MLLPTLLPAAPVVGPCRGRSQRPEGPTHEVTHTSQVQCLEITAVSGGGLRAGVRGAGVTEPRPGGWGTEVTQQ